VPAPARRRANRWGSGHYARMECPPLRRGTGWGRPPRRFIAAQRAHFGNRMNRRGPHPVPRRRGGHSIPCVMPRAPAVCPSSRGCRHRARPCAWGSVMPSSSATFSIRAVRREKRFQHILRNPRDLENRPASARRQSRCPGACLPAAPETPPGSRGHRVSVRGTGRPSSVPLPGPRSYLKAKTWACNCGSGKPSTGRDVVWMNSAQTMLPVLRFSSLPPMRTRVFISASISRMVSSTAAGRHHDVLVAAHGV